jgi:putative membrane-bound dehydrogenase-like protein
VKPSFLGVAALLLVAAASSLASVDKFDFAQPQSPPRPAPPWLKIVDQGTTNPALKGYFTPEGIKVEIVADAPTVINPVGMTFRDDGTPYVLEWRPSPGDEWRETPETFTYKDGSKRNVATMKKKNKDVLKVLGHKGDRGLSAPWYDDSKVILEDELPSSILLHDGWIYLSGRGTVRRFKQSRPDGPYDVKEVIAQGFCGFHHHQVSGMTIGNDGWLYLTSGDDDNFVEGSDGSRATVLRTGAIFRCRPDGSKMQTYALGFRNPYRDVAFDTAFNLFHADNDNEDGSKFTGCRLMHVVEGCDFGWRLRQGARCCTPDPVRGAVYGELPGKVPPMLKTGRGSPAGLLIYNDTRFPEEFRGLLLYPDVFRKLIRAYRVERQGATFAVTEEFEFLKSDDPLFRPCQMVLGPDGAMYVVDWRTDSGGAGRLWGDGRHGRIYRLTWAGTKDRPALPTRPMDSWAKIGKMSDADLFKTLAGPEASDRAKAQRELVRRGERHRPALLRMMLDGDQPFVARAAALGALQSFWNGEVQEAFEKLLTDGNPNLRRLAAEGLGLNAQPKNAEAHNSLLNVLGDADPSVRRAVAMAMGRIGAPGAADSLVNALAFEDSHDVYLRDGLGRAVEALGREGIERLLALADSGVAKDLDRVVETFTSLRTRAGAEALPTLLPNPHLSIEQRAALVRSFSNYLLDPPVAPEPILSYLLAHPREALAVKVAGVETLSVMGALKSGKGADWLLGMLEETEPAARLTIIKAVEESRLAKAVPFLARLLGDSSRPLKEREAAVKALRLLNDRSAVAPLKEVLSARDFGPGSAALRLEALRTLAVLDPLAAIEPARKILEENELGQQTEAVVALGANPEGARLVGRRFLDRKLPRELLPKVADTLRKHAGRDPELAKMLDDVLKSGLLVANSPAEVARIRGLVASQGNPQRGRALFLNGKALACITCHRMEGIGGNVGPDLTRLWDTMSVEKILESILEPSKEIKEGYQTYQATTTKGQVLTGLKMAQSTEEVVLRDANARDVRIAMKDVEELIPLKTSLMPDNAISQLTYEQFIDLMAFLKDQATQESLRGLALDFLVAGPFGPELKTPYPPETRIDLAAIYPGPKPDQTVKWEPVQAEPNGLLNVPAVKGKDRASGYALTHVYSPKAQKVQMLLGSNGGLRVWVNGSLVHENTAARQPRPDQDRITVELKEGWNAVLAKVVGSSADHGLYLRFTGEGLRVARVPDTLGK